MTRKKVLFDDFDLGDFSLEDYEEAHEFATKDIAIIGVAGKFGADDSLQSFWKGLTDGKDGIRSLPEQRKKDVIDFLRKTGDVDEDNLTFLNKAYLSRIDTFDHQLFSFSPTEASTLDPNQRLFLETAWEAIEDAGYGGGKLSGGQTGVFVGYCSISLENYLSIIGEMNQSLVGISAPGNTESIIASRISYLLDLKGPSMVVDTACSSSLTALHLACQSIRNGECSTAIVGGVKISLIPAQQRELSDSNIGINASSGRAKTFDDSSDGTGSGEGAGAILIKPLQQAVEDNDHIYAVIKGSAINQDGKSVGITAPNASAQTDVLLKAWEDADINPESISYIEAHGTATKLGDPVEIGGIEGAFSRHTNKKQFCAIGSVKTNIGHLDGAAGIAGLLKAILVLKTRVIPPNLHFSTPNRNIAFIQSPVYINDCLKELEPQDQPLRCGVSSFGLSGTNCHMVLEEAPINEVTEKTRVQNILSISAKSKESLRRFVSKYRNFVELNNTVSLQSLCYTANTGRGHYQYRLLICPENMLDLQTKLREIEQTDLDSLQLKNVYYGNVEKKTRIVDEYSDRQKDMQANELLKNLLEGNKEENIHRLCKLYVDGANIQWEQFYSGLAIKKISIPTYPFERTRCWVQSERKGTHVSRHKKHPHPLFDRIAIKSRDCTVYTTQFRNDSHWEIHEHQLQQEHLMPGTAFVEMALAAGKEHFVHEEVELRNVLFSNPLVIHGNDEVEVHTQLILADDHVAFSIFSCHTDAQKFVTHAEGKIVKSQMKHGKHYNIEEIKHHCSQKISFSEEQFTEGRIHVGPRWRNTKHLYINENKMLVDLQLTMNFVQELQDYHLYPSLMDAAVNAANALMNNELFLPFHYEKLSISGRLPEKFYSLIQKKEQIENKEIAVFDIEFLDLDGCVFGTVENYCIKNANNIYKKMTHSTKKRPIYHQLSWQQTNKHYANSDSELPRAAVVFADDNFRCRTIIEHLRKRKIDVIEIHKGDTYKQVSKQKYIVSSNEEDFRKLTNIALDYHITHCLFLWCLDDQRLRSIEHLQENIRYSIDGLFYLSKVISDIKGTNTLHLTVVTNYAYHVLKQEENMHPTYTSVQGLCKSIAYEFPNLIVKGIDISANVSTDLIMQEILSNKQDQLVAYRGDVRYIPVFTDADIEQSMPNDVHTVQDQGVYIITGGTGGIGLESAKLLAQKKSVNLVLINRSIFPSRSEWENFIQSSDDKKLISRIEAIKYIENLGSTVTIFSADVSNQVELAEVFTQVRKQYGAINGIIHSAGIAGDGFLILKDKKTFDTVLQPKIFGTWNLHALSKEDNLDFFIMFSSLTSIFGAPGQGDYTAANAFLDSFAYYRKQSGLVATTVNWCGWNETGMALEYGGNEKQGLFETLSNEEGQHILAEVLQVEVTNLLVGEVNKHMLEQVKHHIPIKFEEKNHSITKQSIKDNVVETLDEKVIISGKDEHSLTVTEKKTSRIWSKVLGISEIDVFDKFFEIGGDSLLATYLLKEMNRFFNDTLDITDIFLYPTVVEISSYIDSKLQPVKSVSTNATLAQVDTANIDDILEKLTNGELEVESASNLLQLEYDKKENQ